MNSNSLMIFDGSNEIIYNIDTQKTNVNFSINAYYVDTAVLNERDLQRLTPQNRICVNRIEITA